MRFNAVYSLQQSLASAPAPAPAPQTAWAGQTLALSHA
jgi:hypothetical protein